MLSITPLEKDWKCFISEMYPNQWLGWLAKNFSSPISANNAIKLRIAAIIGWFVNEEKYIPKAEKLAANKIRPNEFAIK